MKMGEVDLNFPILTRRQVITKYLEGMHELKLLAERKYNIRSNQFENYILYHYFCDKNHSGESGPNVFRIEPRLVSTSNWHTRIGLIKRELLKQIIDRKRKILYWLFYLTIVAFCISYKNEASSLVLKNLNTFIYPGMKMWRKMTLPLIKRFPGLTELYDESCLMMNPFFQVDGLNCDPCANVMNVAELDNMDDLEKAMTEVVPFIFKIKQKPIIVDDFRNLYAKNRDIFKRDAFRIQSTNHEITNLEDLFNNFNQTQTLNHRQSHNLWRCNRMQPARKIRQLFQRPERLPSMGIALERYISIDTPYAQPYKLPDTECANMYVQQTMGARFIILRPTLECRHKCRTVSIRLPASFVLIYNWWYWKPISAPDPMTDTPSMSLIGSYC